VVGQLGELVVTSDQCGDRLQKSLTLSGTDHVFRFAQVCGELLALALTCCRGCGPDVNDLRLGCKVDGLESSFLGSGAGGVEGCSALVGHCFEVLCGKRPRLPMPIVWHTRGWVATPGPQMTPLRLQ
jgi:hypothetical protein